MTDLKPRRDRNMDAKRARICGAAATLLAEHGYAGVTTQAVSDELLGMAICSIDHAQPGVKDDALALCPQQLLDRLLHRAGFAEDLPVTDAHLI